MAKFKTVIKRDGSKERYNKDKIINAISKAFLNFHSRVPDKVFNDVFDYVDNLDSKSNNVEDIQDAIQTILMKDGYYDVATSYIEYRSEHRRIREFSKSKAEFIETYKKANNTADSSIDDNANVANKNIAVLNTEMYKNNNINVNRYRVMEKLKQLYPDFDAKQYTRDLEHHIIYKNDENSTFGFPYCAAISMYPFLTSGIKSIGGLSAAPKNIDSFCGMFVNLVFAVSSQFAGAVATSEFLIYLDYFARKEWGDDYYTRPETVISQNCKRNLTIKRQLEQYFQQVVYSINQPSAARGYQSAFWNVSIFDKPFFDGMFSNFVFPDGTRPTWESICWLQKNFMNWLNIERLRTILTFPVVSVSLLFKDGKFEDDDMYKFVADEYGRGDSFFTYISDSADSLASCCRLKNKIQTREFNFTNGNMGVMTGSKSVITLNLNRIIQDWYNGMVAVNPKFTKKDAIDSYADFGEYLTEILDRVYKYHTAYNELLYDLYDAGLLPVYKAGFINLDKQYLTVGLNGLTAAADFMNIPVMNGEEYSKFCQFIFGVIKEQNVLHKTKRTTYNTELIPAESAAAKLYNWDKAAGYEVPKDINLYTSYVFKPYDKAMNIFERIMLHGENYIGDYLDGGAACHLNLSEHLSSAQYRHILKFAAEHGCQYLTFNVPNCECKDCGYIAKQPFDECPRCHSHNVSLWDRIIGYLTEIKNWSKARRIEQSKRVYMDHSKTM